MFNLSDYGWNSFFENNFQSNKYKDFIPARVTVENKNNFLLFCEHGEITGEISGKLMYGSESQSDLPKVGDWVLINYFDKNSPAIIHEVLPRVTKLSRKIAGIKTEEQVIAANIDIIFIVQSLDSTFNTNRIERYLVAAVDSGAKPVVVLSKSDLNNDFEEINKKLIAIQTRAKILFSSSYLNEGIEKIREFILPGLTCALIGPSGAGKSSIINKLIGDDIQPTSEVRITDNRGRHTTTKRELILLPEGGLIIDTPGMRELQLWTDSNSLNSAFPEIDNLSLRCRYSDCSHIHEKNCAVIEAVEKGILPESSYDNYLKMHKELKYLERRMDYQAAQKEKKKWISIGKEMKRFNKLNNR